MKNQLLQICIGLSFVLASSAFLVRTFLPLNASTTTLENLPAPAASTIGKFQWSMVPETANTYATSLVWNTQSGNSTQYIFKSDVWVVAPAQLPASPL